MGEGRVEIEDKECQSKVKGKMRGRVESTERWNGEEKGNAAVVRCAAATVTIQRGPTVYWALCQALCTVPLNPSPTETLSCPLYK